MRTWCGLLAAAVLTAQPPPEAATISGKVVHSLTGAPIRKATVRLTGPNLGLHAITNAEGAFHFPNLPEGFYSLLTTSPGFLETRLRPSINLRNGQSITTTPIRLRPAASLKGRVLDEDGDPLGQAQIRLFKQIFPQGRPRFEFANITTQSNSQGEFSFEGLRPGRYLIQAISNRPTANAGLTYLPTFYPNSSSLDSAVPLDLTPASNLTSLDIRVSLQSIPKSVLLAGRLSGVPAGPQVVVSVSTNSGGSVTAHPPDYAFQLQVMPGQVDLFANVHSGGAQAYAHDNLTISADTTNIVLAMSPAAKLTGQFVLAEANTSPNLQGISITLLSLSINSLTFNTKFDGQGKFFFDMPLPPGRYALNIDPASLPAGYLVGKITLANRPINPDGFDIIASATLQITLAKTAATITARVENKEAIPQSAVFVTLYSVDGSTLPRRQLTLEDGTTTFSALPPGKYILIPFTDLDEDLWQDPNHFKRFPTQSTELTLGPSERKSTVLQLPIP